MLYTQYLVSEGINEAKLGAQELGEMYRVLSRDPSQNGTPGAAGKPEAMEVIFRIPRLEGFAPKSGSNHYTIVVPKFAASAPQTTDADAAVVSGGPRLLLHVLCMTNTTELALILRWAAYGCHYHSH